MEPTAIRTQFRLKWHLCAATVIGMLDTGGTGQVFYDVGQSFDRPIKDYVFRTWAIVVLANAVAMQSVSGISGTTPLRDRAPERLASPYRVKQRPIALFDHMALGKRRPRLQAERYHHAIIAVVAE